MGKNVLLVDDASFMRAKLKMLMNELGHEVIGEAANGAQAIALYAQLKPEVVLMDITMPNMSGNEALKEIRRIDPKAVVIMVSAMGSQSFVLEAVQAGAKDFIVKPFENERVRKVMDSL